MHSAISHPVDSSSWAFFCAPSLTHPHARYDPAIIDWPRDDGDVSEGMVSSNILQDMSVVGFFMGSIGMLYTRIWLNNCES